MRSLYRKTTGELSSVRNSDLSIDLSLFTRVLSSLRRKQLMRAFRAGPPWTNLFGQRWFSIVSRLLEQFQMVGHSKCTVTRCIQNLLEAKRGVERTPSNPSCLRACSGSLFTLPLFCTVLWVLTKRAMSDTHIAHRHWCLGLLWSCFLSQDSGCTSKWWKSVYCPYYPSWCESGLGGLVWSSSVFLTAVIANQDDGCGRSWGYDMEMAAPVYRL